MKKMSLTAFSKEELAAYRTAWESSAHAAAAELADKIVAKWESMSAHERLDRVVFEIKAGPNRSSEWISLVVGRLLAVKPDGFEVYHVRDGWPNWIGCFGQTGCGDFESGSHQTREPDVEV